MSYLNGSAHQQPSQAIAGCNGGVELQHDERRIAPERLQQVRELLSDPFDPGEIKWRVTGNFHPANRTGARKRGQLVAYADQRAYTDRLNEVFGEWGWTRHYDVQVAQNFERRAPGDKVQTTVSAKVVVVSKVTIHGMGSHTVSERNGPMTRMPRLARKPKRLIARALVWPRPVPVRSGHNVDGSRPA